MSLEAKSFICIKACENFLTVGEEYIGLPTSKGGDVFCIRDNGGEAWMVSDTFFLEKSIYIQQERDRKINKITKS
jgi:hypothetical protein